MSNWLPIESAPKDGTEILVYFPQKGVKAVSWDHPYNDVTPDDGLWCVSDDRNGPYPLRGYGYNDETQPTHWQHKPEPPKD